MILHIIYRSLPCIRLYAYPSIPSDAHGPEDSKNELQVEVGNFKLKVGTKNNSFKKYTIKYTFLGDLVCNKCPTVARFLYQILIGSGIT